MAQIPKGRSAKGPSKPICRHLCWLYKLQLQVGVTFIGPAHHLATGAGARPPLASKKNLHQGGQERYRSECHRSGAGPASSAVEVVGVEPASPVVGPTKCEKSSARLMSCTGGMKFYFALYVGQYEIHPHFGKSPCHQNVIGFCLMTRVDIQGWHKVGCYQL